MDKTRIRFDLDENQQAEASVVLRCVRSLRGRCVPFPFGLALLVGVAAVMLGGLMTLPLEEDAPLKPGLYQSDPLNNPRTLDGAMLEIMEDRTAAAFRFNGTTTTLKLSEPADPADAVRPGCYTIDHVFAAEQRRATGSLQLHDRDVEAQWLHADCGLAVELMLLDGTSLLFQPPHNIREPNER